MLLYLLPLTHISKKGCMHRYCPESDILTGDQINDIIEVNSNGYNPNNKTYDENISFIQLFNVNEQN
jgi:hypothetical protein